MKRIRNKDKIFKMIALSLSALSVGTVLEGSADAGWKVLRRRGLDSKRNGAETPVNQKDGPADPNRTPPKLLDAEFAAIDNCENELDCGRRQVGTVKAYASKCAGDPASLMRAFVRGFANEQSGPASRWPQAMSELDEGIRGSGRMMDATTNREFVQECTRCVRKGVEDLKAMLETLAEMAKVAAAEKSKLRGDERNAILNALGELVNPRRRTDGRNWSPATCYLLDSDDGMNILMRARQNLKRLGATDLTEIETAATECREARGKMQEHIFTLTDAAETLAAD